MQTKNPWVVRFFFSWGMKQILPQVCLGIIYNKLQWYRDPYETSRIQWKVMKSSVLVVSKDDLDNLPTMSFLVTWYIYTLHLDSFGKSGPQKVAFGQGNHRLFQGNLGWWNMISFGQTSLQPLWHLWIQKLSCVSMRCWSRKKIENPQNLWSLHMSAYLYVSSLMLPQKSHVNVWFSTCI